LVLVVFACSPGREPGEASPTSDADPAEAAPISTAEDAALLWVAVEDARELVLVDVAARRVVQRHGVPGRPHNLTVAPNGTAVTTLQRAGTVALVGKGSVVTVELGGSPHDVKATDDGFVVTNEGSRRLDLLAEDGEREHTIDLKANPHDVAVRSSVAWVSLDGTDEIAVVDLRRRKVDRYLTTGKRPHDLRFDGEGRGWVTDWNGTLHVFDARGELVKTLTLGSEAHHLAFTADGDEAWVTDHGTSRTYVVSTESLEVRDTLPIPGAPHHVALTPNGRWAGVADHDRGTLVVFDARDPKKSVTIEVGPGPHGVWAAGV
jgi:DNA-binding beta-propeller fold protein YncE